MAAIISDVESRGSEARLLSLESGDERKARLVNSQRSTVEKYRMIFAKLNLPSDHFNCMLVCKRWARNTVDLLWHRPSCTTWEKHSSICRTLAMEHPYFAYRHFIKRLNLASLAVEVNDGSVFPLATCTRIERLTLTGCKGLSDSGLKALVEDSGHLLALDISGDDQITEESIFAIADSCPLLQGLNISNCSKISNEGIIRLAKSCKYIKRVCAGITFFLAPYRTLIDGVLCPDCVADISKLIAQVQRMQPAWR